MLDAVHTLCAACFVRFRVTSIMCFARVAIAWTQETYVLVNWLRMEMCLGFTQCQSSATTKIVINADIFASNRSSIMEWPQKR